MGVVVTVLQPNSLVWHDPRQACEVHLSCQISISVALRADLSSCGSTACGSGMGSRKQSYYGLGEIISICPRKDSGRILRHFQCSILTSSLRSIKYMCAMHAYGKVSCRKMKLPARTWIFVGNISLEDSDLLETLCTKVSFCLLSSAFTASGIEPKNMSFCIKDTQLNFFGSKICFYSYRLQSSKPWVSSWWL